MKVTNEKTENSQVFLTIEMEPPEVEESLEEAYHSLVQKTKIPGFRKGKAPRTILERHIGRENLLEEAINSLVPQAYEKALKEQEIEAIAQPQVEVTQTDPLVFKAIVPLKPTVKLGDYQHIHITPEPVEVAEGAVNDVIEQLRHQRATWEPVERPVDFGDMVVFDVTSTIDDEPFVNQKGAQYQVMKDLAFPVPGFAEQLVGMNKDAEKEFNVQIASDYSKSELAGKEPSFKVTMTEIKQEILPELSDEFAIEVNSDFKTMDFLREQISSEMTLRAEEKTRAAFEEQVIDAVVDLSELEFPPILVETEVHRMLDQRFQGGNQELAEYLASMNKTEEELHEELHPLATKSVIRSLVLGQIIQEEKIEASDSEIDTEIENTTQTATGDKDEIMKILNTPQARQSIGQTLITRQAVQRLVGIAKGLDEIKTTKEEK